MIMMMMMMMMIMKIIFENMTLKPSLRPEILLLYNLTILNYLP